MLESFYSESRTWLHAVGPGVKLLALTIVGSLLWRTHSVPLLLGLGLGCVLVFVSLGRATWRVRALLVSLVLAALLVAGLHGLLQQVELGVLSMVRLISVALLGLSLTLTTSSTELLDLLERVLAPLQRVGWRPAHLALRVALMLRFSGHFFVQWQRLDEAYRLRTGRAGGLRLIAPLTILMLTAARRVADTLQIRLGE